MPEASIAAATGIRPPPQAIARRGPAPGRVFVVRAYGTTLLLMAILALATALRVWNIDALGANSDEAVYAGQAAAIAGQPDLEPLFPVFRAHPLLVQTLLSLGYHAGGGLVVARIVCALLGVATVYVTFRLGRALYGPAAGLAGALLLAVMPYHVVVTRQVLLDGPMVFCATITLYLLTRFAATGRPRWLHAAAGALGLTVLCKEPSILLLGAVYVFLALTPEVRLRRRDLGIAAAIIALVVATAPLVVMLAGSTKTGGNYLAWQLLRRPNHGWGFYAEILPRAIGPALLVAAAVGLWLLRGERSWRETLLLSWIAIPAAFFELWPVKGYQYLLPVAPAVAVLAGRLATRWPVPARGGYATARWPAWVPSRLLLTMLLALSVLPATLARIAASPSASMLAGTGGMPAGREAGSWLARNLPAGAQLMTIGPSMANVIAFYGHHRSYALSVSPNPLNRNPSYQPLINPDLAIREGRVQYAVWDAFSAGRSPFFSRRLLRYVERYRGRVVHQQILPVRTAGGRTARRPLIVVYVLRG